MSVRDTDVERKGSSLAGQRILVGVTGGIAAVDTVRLLREMRRHGAEMLVIMTESAQIQYSNQAPHFWQTLEFEHERHVRQA